MKEYTLGDSKPEVACEGNLYFWLTHGLVTSHPSLPLIFLSGFLSFYHKLKIS